MAEKRRASTRNLREPAAKRRNTLVTPSTRSTPAREASATRPAEKIEPRLPSRIDDNSPLPTIPVGHASIIASNLQSIAESGVLTASLLRSRNAWLNEGLFEKFYTKPVKKKKGEQESLNNPPTRCMTKVGTCQIIIEPHMLEATLYTIREWKTDMPAPPLPAPKTFTPIAATPGVPFSSLNSFTVNPTIATPLRAPNPNTGSGTTVTSSGAGITPATPQSASTTPLSTLPPDPSNATTIPTPAGLVGYQPAQPLSTNHTPIQPQRSIQGTHPTPSVNRPVPTPAAPTQDPVIQMLAQRASIDPALKALMKVVASGSANQDQLREFQRHIDELNAIVARQRLNMSSTYNNFTPATQSPYPASTGTPNAARAPPLGGTPVFQRGPSTFGTPPTSIQRPIKAAPVAPQPIIGLAMEFTGSNGDRYLFPKYSILEFAPEAKCIIASFLVVRSFSTSAPDTGTNNTSKPGPSKKASISSTTPTPIKTEVSTSSPTATANNQGPLYHQPVTMRITADNAKVFEQISKTVSSLDEARRHMEDTMAKTKRVDDVVLALRLPVADDSTADAMPGTPGVNDGALRRGSMALFGKTGTNTGIASPGGGEVGSKKKKTKVEEVCGYCLAPVGAGAGGGHGIDVVAAEMVGAEVTCCQSCAGLLRKSGKLPARTRLSNGVKVVRKVEGPKVLMLEYEVC